MSQQVTLAEIREGVKATFDAVALAPDRRFRFSVGPAFARRLGYPDHALDRLPPLVSESFTGLAYLHPHLG